LGFLVFETNHLAALAATQVSVFEDVGQDNKVSNSGAITLKKVGFRKRSRNKKALN
jgi:hypothetical protein